MRSAALLDKITTFASSSSAVFKKIEEPLSRILFFSLADDTIYPAKILSVSLEKSLLSVAYGSRFFSRIKIKGVREYSFEDGRYPQPEVLASSLSLAINDMGASKSEVSLSIPKAWTIIKTAEFPATVKENLSNVISYELDRITPFSSEEAFYDFRILREEAGKLSVLVAAAKADVVRPYIDALKEKGINVGRVTINLTAIETLCRFMDKKADSVFVKVTKDGYEGALFLSGSITTFADNFTREDDETKADMIASGIAQSVDALIRHEKTPQIILLLPDKSSSLKELVKSKVAHPLRILNETGLPVRLSGQYKEMPYAAIGTVMESLWKKAGGFNLLSKGSHQKAKSPRVFTIFLVAAILAMWILYIIAPLRVEEKRLQEIDRQISLRKGEVKKVEALKKEIESLNGEISTIDNFKGNKPMALNILKELTTILPRNTWVSRVRITETTVELEGYAASATGILSRLEASRYFKKSEFASPTFRDVRMNADRFNVKMVIEGYKQDETKKAVTGKDEEE